MNVSQQQELFGPLTLALLSQPSDAAGSGICTNAVAVAFGIQSPSVRPSVCPSVGGSKVWCLQVAGQENAQMPAVCVFPCPHTLVEALLSP